MGIISNPRHEQKPGKLMREFEDIDASVKAKIAGRQVELRLSNGDEVIGVWDKDGDYGNGAWGVIVGGRSFSIWSDDAVQPMEYRELSNADPQ